MSLLEFLFKNSDKVVIIFFIGIILYTILDSFLKKKKNSKMKEIQKTISSEIADNTETTEKINEQDEKLPYRRKYLLTKNEFAFYKSLKEIADKLDLTILAKVRLADLVEVSVEADRSEYLRYFGKIQAKHIDFMLCKKENLYPELLIELNDNSHKTDKRAERDDFVSRVLEKAGYKLLFVYGTGDLEKKSLSF